MTAWYPAAEVNHPGEAATNQLGWIDQGQVHVGVEEAPVDRTAPVREVAGHAPISVRTANSSGKKVSSRAFCRKAAPLDPPVPCFMPMMRCTVFR